MMGFERCEEIFIQGTVGRERREKLEWTVTEARWGIIKYCENDLVSTFCQEGGSTSESTVEAICFHSFFGATYSTGDFEMQTKVCLSCPFFSATINTSYDAGDVGEVIT